MLNPISRVKISHVKYVYILVQYIAVFDKE